MNKKRHTVNKLSTDYIFLFLSILIFIVITLLVFNGITNNFDVNTLLALRNPFNKNVTVFPSWLTEAFKDFTALGSVTIIVITSIFSMIFFIAGKKYLIAVLFLVPVIGGGVSDILLKEIFARPRPNIVPHLVKVFTFSFPSGHAVMSIALYFTLSYISVHLVKDKILKRFIYTAAAIFIIIIGFSRIYLGVHYPTDVFAGWCLGAMWFLFFKIISYNKFN